MTVKIILHSNSTQYIQFVIHEKQSLWNSVIRVDFIDNHLKHVYRGIKVYLREVPPIKQNIAVYICCETRLGNEMRMVYIEIGRAHV